ncbi:MAG: RecQ family ATP-dependent DNA helicase [Rhodobacteraceae bacterium]|nr:RecQ family ATP-dependent DNA helicase [Paracoccaceae bacterium]MCY4138614.1 RecQ family ATP-dependent DNA helicase [Paracoccaceae bacterium]
MSLLRKALKDQTVEFRPGQWEAIHALVNRQERRLVVERTGWGKSSVYFVATRILRDRGRGPTIIVSPLLSLMRNQIETANQLGINALTINSTNRERWPELERSLLEDEADTLLISPERLANDEFVNEVLLPISQKTGLLVVDEAHCISDWGHDFRPDYRRLTNVVQRMPQNVPILCTTATANDRVIRDIREQLGEISVQRGSLMRDSLILQTLRLPSQSARLAWLADYIGSFPGTGIIYVLTKRDASQVARWLEGRGIPSSAYYSGVKRDGFEDSNTYRQHLENQLLRNEIKALVSTTALGMGFDKPDLGFVVHYQAPSSAVAYYQQVGRAGRGIDHAVGIMITGREDDAIHAYFRRTAFPEEKWVNAILQALDESDGMSVIQLEETVNLRRSQIEKVLKFLSVENPSPAIKIEGIWRRTAERYLMDHEKIQRLTRQRESEWEQVQEYIDEKGCLMEFLARVLDDANPRPCGRCSSCQGRPIVGTHIVQESASNAARFLRRSEIPLECKKQVAARAFPTYGFTGNLPVLFRAETGRVLSRWGDAGWGQQVANEKQHGYFSDDLVDAVVEMLNERWRPKPAPEWVTCIPSRIHPFLVPHYARRLAETLELPFMPAVRKVRDNKPQKLQQNRFHQCWNLDGVFAVESPVPDSPVLLVDDVFDSGWTLTIAAALLRQAGSGPVWPLALATSSMGR